MLRQRVVTGLVFAALVIGLLLYAPAQLTAIAFGLLVLAASLEWAALLGLQSRPARLAYVALIGACLVASGASVGAFPATDTGLLRPLFVFAAAFWLLAAIAVSGYPRGVGLWGRAPVLGLIGVVVLVPPWIAALFIRSLPHGEYLLIYAIALIAFADIGAYFAGRAIGGAKLMPRVSPGKTLAGLAGGMLSSIGLAVLVGAGFGLHGSRLALWVALGALAALASVFGDLLESMVKRHGGHKDSGSLLPGHGGLFDRLDSLTAGLPVLALGMLCAGGFWP